MRYLVLLFIIVATVMTGPARLLGEMSHLNAMRKAALTLGPSANAHLHKTIIKERKFWFDETMTDKCIAFNKYDEGILGTRMEICAKDWEEAFRTLPLAQPILEGDRP